ncbi:MAG TPA: ATP-binding protein [Candidatus Nanoarchaeia archaeon]|nr:ATP-binding protein [Candidatus Nanoarchaeia archaeon]
MTRKGTVSIHAGKNLASVISRTLARDHYAAIKELVSNSYDADAENVGIRVSTLEDCLSIEDDGSGMDEQELQGFYRMGDSAKLAEPISPKGRRRIGKFGIATVLLEYLCGSYTLETWKRSQKIIVRERFRDTHAGKKPRVYVERSSRRVSGTKITMTDLKFDKHSFDPDKLKSILEWEVPCLPDFKILLNGVLLPKRGIVTFCTEYLLDQVVPGVGRVHGSVFYNDRKMLATPGIFVYVHGRSVGSPDAFNSHLSNSMRNRVVGIINADGLEGHVVFDRASFREDSNEYLAVQKAITSMLASVSTDIRDFTSPRKFFTHRGRGVDLLLEGIHAAEAKLNRELVPEGEKPYHFELQLDERNPWVSRLDPEQRVIYINASNRQFSKLVNMSPKDAVAYPIIMLALSAIADHQVGADDASRQVVFALGKNTRLVARDIFQGMESLSEIVRVMKHGEQDSSVPIDEIRLNNHRLYTVYDISTRSGYDVNTLYYLCAAGVLIPTRKDTYGWKFSANQIMKVLRQVDGYVPLGRVLAQKEYMEHFRTSNKDPFIPLETEVASMPDLPAYMRDFGKTHPMMFVKRGSVDEAKAYFAARGVPR